MTYQQYADHHLEPRPPCDCGTPDCLGDAQQHGDSRYPADLVESDGGEA